MLRSCVLYACQLLWNIPRRIEMVSVCTGLPGKGKSCEPFGGYKTINRIPLPTGNQWNRFALQGVSNDKDIHSEIWWGYINPLMLKDISKNLSSGSLILMTTIFELRLILQNIWRRVVIYILINISPSNIFLNMFSPAIFHQNCQAVLDFVSINGLSTFSSRVSFQRWQVPQEKCLAHNMSRGS